MRFPIEVLPKFLGQTAVGFAMLTLVIYCIRTNKSGRQTEFVCSHWRIYKVPVHFHIIQSSLNRESLNTSKNIIMRFLRLLLFLFVLLAPLLPTASHVGIKACSMGDRGACQSCCDKCLTDPEQFLDLHELPTPAVCRHFCQRRNSCTIAHWLLNLILQLTDDRGI